MITGIGFCTFNKLCHTYSKYLSFENQSEQKETPYISLNDLYQLIFTKLSHHTINITNITYLGHGDDFDSFSIKIKNNKQLYVIRIIRENTPWRVECLKNELQLQNELTAWFCEHETSINIQIPTYSDNKHSICSLLQNTNNPHKSFIYATYPMIQGTQLYNFSDETITELLTNNSTKLAVFLSILHQYVPQQADIWGRDVTDELEWITADLERNQLNVPFDDQIFSNWIKTHVIEKCNNILIPIMQQYDSLYGDSSTNKILKGLIHGDLHGNHLLFTNKKLNGIIDWTDARISPIAAEFRHLWAINQKITLDIVCKYKRFRKLDEDKKELFDICVNIYGYIALLEDMYWHITNNSDRNFTKSVILRCKKNQALWQVCSDAFVKSLSI